MVLISSLSIKKTCNFKTRSNLSVGFPNIKLYITHHTLNCPKCTCASFTFQLPFTRCITINMKTHEINNAIQNRIFNFLFLSSYMLILFNNSTITSSFLPIMSGSIHENKIAANSLYWLNMKSL